MQPTNTDQEEMHHVVVSVPAGIAEKASTAPSTDIQQLQHQPPRWSLARRLLVGGAIAAISVGAVHMVFESQRRRNHHRMMELGLEDEDGNYVGPRGGEMSERGGKYGDNQGRVGLNDDDMKPHHGKRGHHGDEGRPERDGENRPEGRPQRDGENRPEGRPQRDGENRPEGRPQRDGEKKPGLHQRAKHGRGEQNPSVVSPVLAAPKQLADTAPHVAKAAL